MKPEIVRKNFVRWGHRVYEEEDFRARDPGTTEASWSSYCFFVPEQDSARIAERVRLNGRDIHVDRADCQTPPGTWFFGPRWQLEMVIDLL